MIAEMKKYAFLVFHRDYDKFLGELGRLGVLHVIGKETGGREEVLDELQKQHQRIDRIMSLLAKVATEETTGESPSARNEVAPEETTGGSPSTWDEPIPELSGRAEELDERIKQLNTRREEVLKELDRITPWGAFDGDDLEKLVRTGYRPVFYRCPDRRFDPSWEEMENLFVINREAGNTWFLVLAGPDGEPEIDAEKVEPGDRSPAALKELLAQIDHELEAGSKELARLSEILSPVLEREKARLDEEISLLEVYRDTQKATGDAVMILEGWVPVENRARLDKWLEKESVVHVVMDPGEEDVPPVHLRNNRFSRLFEPISRLFDLPSYGEMDLTPYFAPFFMIFFGFCLGDAGYGIFFILFATLLKRRAKKQLRPILTLTQYLGVATILFGLISGTFFGVNLIDSGYTLTSRSFAELENAGLTTGQIGDLRTLEGTYFRNRADFQQAMEQTAGPATVETYRKTIIRSAEAGIPLVGRFRHLMQDPQSMFYLSLLIGASQILFGIFIRIFNVGRQKGFMHALPIIGWLILILTLVLQFGGIFETAPARYLFYGLLAVSGILIFVLNKPGAGILTRLGSGVWDSYSMVTGLFGDLLSYIRLFALGISSAILGFVFNDISLQLLNIPYIGWLFFLILLLAGHSINLFLATLGAFIHPMRLTFVEFYKNAGFKGGGKKYDPFVLNNQ